jgi:DNA (cytosine-5)-methyltransferase 1
LDYQNEIEKLYLDAFSSVQSDSVSQLANSLSDEQLIWIEEVLRRAEVNKGVATVFLTCLLVKAVRPEQDIRCHQEGMEGGYSGRVIDTRYVTPFLKSKRFPSMSESGWLTRSLEHPHPYTLDYPGKITPSSLKECFLNLLDAVERQPSLANIFLRYALARLIEARDKAAVAIINPVATKSWRIRHIVALFGQHFSFPYKTHGAARLPVLALYAAYQCLIEEMDRYKGMNLCPLESHTSPDRRSGAIGDIEIRNNDEPFEGVEVKHGIEITKGIVEEAYTKIRPYPIARYYVLSTREPSESHRAQIEEALRHITEEHGCDIIVNGVLHTLEYYLRLVDNPQKVLDNYVGLLETDPAVKSVHKEQWNILCVAL